MSDNTGFFDTEAILPHILVLLVGKMVKNGSKLAKIKVYLENPQNANRDKLFFSCLLYHSEGTPQCFKSRCKIVLILKHWRQNDPFVERLLRYLSCKAESKNVIYLIFPRNLFHLYQKIELTQNICWPKSKNPSKNYLEQCSE